jgi:hypothetical protein
MELCWEVILLDYNIEINRLFKEMKNGTVKTEIWAEITNKITSKTLKKRIWWKDENDVYHDGVRELPIDVRDAVDNAWIEKSRKW